VVFFKFNGIDGSKFEFQIERIQWRDDLIEAGCRSFFGIQFLIPWRGNLCLCGWIVLAAFSAFSPFSSFYVIIGLELHRHRNMLTYHRLLIIDH
jgi:hypothetical protein